MPPLRWFWMRPRRPKARSWSFCRGKGKSAVWRRCLRVACPAVQSARFMVRCPLAAQRAAIAPDATARKIVLATSIAETSLTIEDVRVVVDCGLARRARFDPGTGMSRLVTERVTRAEATQRAGRAGRVAEGVCFRMWARAEEGALAAFAPPEIARADLAGLALELAAWGGDDLRFLTPPPDAALAEARALLADLGALDGAGRITAHGRAMVALPLHPRLAHMVLHAGQGAAPMAALLSEGDVLRAAPVDLSLRLDALRDAKALQARHPYDLHRPTLERARDTLRRIKRQGVGSAGLSPAEIAALAYPDRIGLRRKGDAPRYVLSGGKGAVLPEGDPLAQARLLVVTDTDWRPARGAHSPSDYDSGKRSARPLWRALSLGP